MTPTWAPTRLLALAAVAALLLVAIAWFVATRQPWLGVDFSPSISSPGISSPGLLVTHVDPRSPNRGQLLPGDIVNALSDGERVEKFGPDTLQEGGVNLPSYAAYNRFMDHHRVLWGILNGPQFEFLLVDGRHVTGNTDDRRPGLSLPWQFWFLVLIGTTTFLIGVGIWSFCRQQIAARLVLIGGTGLFIATLLTAIVSARELSLSPWWLKVGTDGDSLGAEIISYSIIALLWHYPAPLGRFPMATLCGIVVALIWGNETFQIVEWPLQAYLMHYLFAFTIMAVVAVLQWRNSRHQALSRAALQWFLLTLLLGSGAVTILFFVPAVFSGNPIVPAVVAYAMAPLMYLGLAFGTVRYRLFDLERWWLEVWLWLAGGGLVIVLDLLLITVFQVADLLALGFALILAGWVYLPIRQWLFRRMLSPVRTRLDDHLPLLIETLFSNEMFSNEPNGSFAERWRELVNRVFVPMNLTVQAQPATQTILAESGLALHVPSFNGDSSFELRFREQGRRLYTPRDVMLADSLLSLTRRVAALWQQREEAAHTERGRIMRDLHDDVAARLLTLVHRANDTSFQNLARQALTALRDTIYTLDTNGGKALEDALDDLRFDVRERLDAVEITLDWRMEGDPAGRLLSPRQHINLQRIVQELVSNAIHHSNASLLRVLVMTCEAEVILKICDNGVGGDATQWVAGKGLHNVTNRTQELGGQITWTDNPSDGRGCCVRLSLPLK